MQRIALDCDVKAMRLFYDDIESHVRNLDVLGIHSRDYGALLAPVIIERRAHHLKLIIGQISLCYKQRTDYTRKLFYYR